MARRFHQISPRAGGQRQERDKRGKDDLKPGDVRMLGHVISKMWLHAPAFKTLNMGSSIRRVAEQINKPGDLKGITTGALAGTLQDASMVSTGARVEKLLSMTPEVDYQRGELAKSSLMPLGVQQAAEYFDPHADVKRQP